METWLSCVAQFTEASVLVSPEPLAKLFTLDLNSVQVPSIQSSLASHSEKDIARAVEQAALLDDEWPGFVALARSYLVWCAFVDPNDLASCFTLYANMYTAAQQAYANQRGSCLNLVIRGITREMVRLFSGEGNAYAEWIAAGLLKLFNAVRAEREASAPNAPLKKDNAIFYANTMSRLYFRTEQFVSAGNVFNNMHSLGLTMSSFPMAEQVEYRFWLGRFLLYRNDVAGAYIHLNWACESTPPGTPQFALILDWLLVPAILVGRRPNLQVAAAFISAPALSFVQSLLHALQRAELPPAFRQEIVSNQWVARRHLRPVLDKHLPTLIYRRGLQRLIEASRLDKIPLQLVRVSFSIPSESDPSLILAEEICEMLTSKGMLKGNVLPASQTLVLKASGSVPSLKDVLVSNYHDRDDWLRQ